MISDSDYFSEKMVNSLQLYTTRQEPEASSIFFWILSKILHFRGNSAGQGGEPQFYRRDQIRPGRGGAQERSQRPPRPCGRGGGRRGGGGKEGGGPVRLLLHHLPEDLQSIHYEV